MVKTPTWCGPRLIIISSIVCISISVAVIIVAIVVTTAVKATDNRTVIETTLEPTSNNLSSISISQETIVDKETTAATNVVMATDFTSSSVIVRPPWPGSFRIIGYCRQSQCCCPVNTITITDASQGTINVNARFSTTNIFLSTCFIANTLANPFRTSYPESYNTTVTILDTIYTLSLSSNGSIISIKSSRNSVCGETAIRN